MWVMVRLLKEGRDLRPIPNEEIQNELAQVEAKLRRDFPPSPEADVESLITFVKDSTAKYLTVGEKRFAGADLQEKYVERNFNRRMYTAEYKAQQEIDASSILESAIDAKYINRDSTHPQEIYITLAGKKFSGFDGLIIAWVTELGPLRGAVLGAIIASVPWIYKLVIRVL